MAEQQQINHDYFERNPFGTRIHADEVRENFAFFDDWEERYRFILDLGRQLPEMPEALKVPENIIHGCQSQAWIAHRRDDGRLLLMLDSDAHIVRGLIAIVMSALNAKAPRDVLDYDIDGLFEELDLIRHLTPTRGNGLRAMVGRIKEVAASEV